MSVCTQSVELGPVNTGTLIFVLIFISALGCGLIAGIFFAFSTFVMKALAELPPAQGIAAMQSINVVVINRWFMTLFFGSGVACLLLAIFAILHWQTPGAAWLFAGSAFYLGGTIFVTILCNVPRNNILAALDPTTVQSATAWEKYVSSWTAWNHVRTIAALVASGSHTMALCS